MVYDCNIRQALIAIVMAENFCSRAGQLLARALQRLSPRADDRLRREVPMRKNANDKKSAAKSAGKSQGKSKAKSAGACACGQVQLEIDLPAFWAWHDHSRASQRAQGCAYATYIGCWKSKVRVVKGRKNISSFEEVKTGAVRSFCVQCGTPLFYERARAPKMVNIPRALFDARTGREPLYHIGLNEAAEWEYRAEPLVPLKAYPGVMWTRAKRKKPQDPAAF
jgi:hypothetical protein